VILRDSISSSDKTPVSDLYNTFLVNYAWNPASGKFERCLAINKVSAASFPDASTTTWTEYVQGVSSTSWGDASALWNICHDSYVKAQNIQRLEDAISDCYWYTDPAIYLGEQSAGASVDESAYKFLHNLVEWTSKQKETIRYSIPMTATNLALELLDVIVVNDAIYTAAANRTGWITKIEVDPKADEIKLEVTLNPIDLEQGTAGDSLIIERGSVLNTDTITESGSQTNTYTET
jgi:hypothetical protein